MGPPGRGEGRGEGLVSSLDSTDAGEGLGVGGGSLVFKASNSERAVEYSELLESRLATTFCIAR